MDTPFIEGELEVTREEAAGIRKFVAAIKPGIYVKCSQCNRLKWGLHEIKMGMGDVQTLCEECT